MMNLDCSVMNRRFSAVWVLLTAWALVFPGAMTGESQVRTTRSRNNEQVLKFDALEKRQQTTPGDREARFIFTATNTTDETVIIEDVQTSCGCTSVMKKSPWVIAPGKTDNIEVIMDLLGRQGTVTKSVYVFTDKGVQTLKVVSEIPTRASREVGGSNLSERQRNQLKALRDRQIVFRGDCARCHAKPTEGLAGAKLYDRACGICHNSPNRASMVPDLAKVDKVKDKLYWEIWIKYGRKGSLMPAFHHTQGGPLSDDQVNSLVAYLLEEFPSGVVEIPEDQEMKLKMEDIEKPEPPAPGVSAAKEKSLFEDFDPLTPVLDPK